jgi:transcriptional regulator with XRE-family HTH domain
MDGVALNNGADPVTHFGRQMRKERLARGWSLREFAARTGINIAQASRIETGKSPPTERVAAACDVAFPERKNWFSEYYEESKSWMPAGFRSWAEYEDRAAELLIWSPGIIDGLAQTEGYARALLSIHPGATGEVVTARLKGRLERQQRLLRDDGPAVGLLSGHARAVPRHRVRRGHGRAVRAPGRGRQAGRRDSPSGPAREDPAGHRVADPGRQRHCLHGERSIRVGLHGR